MRKIQLLLAFAPVLCGQTMVESAILKGNSAVTAGKAGSATGAALSKTLGATAGKLDAAAKGLAGGASSPSSTPQATASTAALPAGQNTRVEERKELPNVALLKVGMSREELEKAAGKPSQVMSLPEGGKLIERYKYIAGAKELRLVLEDGKVTEIKP